MLRELQHHPYDHPTNIVFTDILKQYRFETAIILLILILAFSYAVRLSRMNRELKAMSQSLKESGERYRRLTESMQDVVWTVDTTTMKFTYLSPSASKLRGYNRDEILNGTLEDTLVPMLKEPLQNLIQIRAAELRDGKSSSDDFFTHEIEQPCKDGTTVYTEVTVHFWLNPSTDHVELHGVTRDITDRKVAEKILSESEEKHGSCSKKQFLHFHPRNVFR